MISVLSPEPPIELEPQERASILNASRELFQRGLRDIVQRAGVDASLLAAFVNEIGRQHDALANRDSADGFTDSSGLTSSRMTLMADADLKFEIRIGEITKHLRDTGGRDLWRTRTRYMTLLQRSTMAEDEHPLGSEVIGDGLWAIVRHGGSGSQANLNLLDQLEELFSTHLTTLYRSIDQLLASRRVLPAGEVLSVGRTQPGSAAPNDNSVAAPNTLAVLRLALARQATHGIGLPTGFVAGGTADNNPLLNAAALVTLNRLLDRLTNLEQRTVSAVNPSSSAQVAKALNPVKADDLDLPPDRPEAVTIDTMALIFEGIFANDELPPMIRSAIAHLQIPLLKRAITDPTLFTDAQHPARELINRIGRASLGLPWEAGNEQPIYQRIVKLCTQAAQVVDNKEHSLAAPLAELAELIQARDQEIVRAAEPLQAIVEGHENQIYASRLTDEWLDACLSQTSAPEIATFLDSYWRRVMIAAARAGGNRWQQSQATAEELLWSVTPKQAPEERKRLAGLASSLIKRLDAGLDSVGVSAIERRPFMNILFDLQTAALRAQSSPPAPTPAAIPARRPRSSTQQNATTCEAQMLEMSGRHVHYLGIPPAAALPATLNNDDWQIGDWLRFRMANQKTSTGLCCWQSPLSGVVLLHNRQWRAALVRPPVWIDTQLRSGQATVVSRQALFDSAVAHALARLKAA